MWLAEQISGNRKTYGMNLVGGVRRDIPQELHPKVLEVIEKIETETLAVADAVPGDTTLMLRLKGVGILSHENAKQICVCGPTARGSGVDIDARIDHPYSAYAEVPPEIKVHTECDNLARVLVRIEETLDSIRIVREALAEMPDGPIMAEIKEEIPPDREGLRVVEAPRGEAVHYVLSGDDNRPYRWKVRAPTYQNLQALPVMIKNVSVADVPITLGSMDPCFSCTERVETISVKSGEKKVYTQQELLELSRAKYGRAAGRGG